LSITGIIIDKKRHEKSGSRGSRFDSPRLLAVFQTFDFHRVGAANGSERSQR